ncbi:hypothetical protein A2U01_0074838 [Trifolium medium]|uniref:Uncharacterized protein n=1 Tax=Trifolium medium TaxID=97028 RepID=A0A392SXK7_9FABA|nr:hypothetical protein [Trifolium medium]
MRGGAPAGVERRRVEEVEYGGLKVVVICRDFEMKMVVVICCDYE